VDHAADVGAALEERTIVVIPAACNNHVKRFSQLPRVPFLAAVDSFDSPWGLASIDGSRLLVTDPESGGLLVAVDGSDAPLVRIVPE
jgi:hypothetical protein